LEARLNQEARVGGRPIGRARKFLAFTRLLARLQASAPDAWALKGGFALELRLPGRARALGLTLEETLAHLGATTRDIYLNDVAYWRNVPAGVWSYTIGGYQVMKKWLSYRERSLLGRDLSKDEAREVMNMGCRVAAILLLEPALDANYRAVTVATWAWDRGPEGGGAPGMQPA
jgi:hypothetical protein